MRNILLTDDIVSQKPENSVDVDFFDYVPESLDNVLNCFLTDSLVAEALNAWSSIRKNVWWFNRKACFIDRHSAASFASVSNDIAHTALKSLRFTVWNAFACSTLSPLLTNRSVVHRWWLGTISVSTWTSCFLFACGVSCFTALNTGLHELTVLTARRVLITANSALILTQFAVLVTALVVVFGAQQTSIALLVTFNSKISTERFFRLWKAATTLRLQHFSDRTERTRWELFVVDIIAADWICVHEETSTLACWRRTFWDVWIVFTSPIMPKLVSSNEVSFSRNHTLSVMVPRWAQTRVQIERVTILEVFWRDERKRY